MLAATTLRRLLRLLQSAARLVILQRLAATALRVRLVTALHAARRLSNQMPSGAFEETSEILCLTGQYLFLYLHQNRDYGDSEDKECVVLQGVRKREPEMDGQVSCVRGVEYDGRGDSCDW